MTPQNQGIDAIGHHLYQHQALDTAKKEIRLLRRQGGVTTPLLWSLERYELDHAPEYRALSYAWGPKDDQIAFDLANKQLYIGRNLSDFFTHVDPAHMGHNIWVDQICIDQKSVEERNHQVTIMAEIYRQAAEVIVWLGPGSPHNAMLYQLIAACKTDTDLLSLKRLGIVFEGVGLSRFGSYEHRYMLYDVWKEAAQSFMDLDYWTRLWPVQEVLLARKLVAFMGSRMLSWRKLQYFEVLMRRLMAVPSRMRFLLTKGQSSRPEMRHHYLELMSEFAGNLCSDPRDKL